MVLMFSMPMAMYMIDLCRAFFSLLPAVFSFFM